MDVSSRRCAFRGPILSSRLLAEGKSALALDSKVSCWSCRVVDCKISFWVS